MFGLCLSELVLCCTSEVRNVKHFKIPITVTVKLPRRTTRTKHCIKVGMALHNLLWCQWNWNQNCNCFIVQWCRTSVLVGPVVGFKLKSNTHCLHLIYRYVTKILKYTDIHDIGSFHLQVLYVSWLYWWHWAERSWWSGWIQSVIWNIRHSCEARWISYMAWMVSRCKRTACLWWFQ